MNITSIKDIKKGLENILSTDFSSNTTEEIHQFILNNLFSIPYRNLIIDTSKASFPPIYRARRAEDIDGKLDNTIQTTYSFPPSKYASIGRLNIEKHPVFYGSDSFINSVLELKTIKSSDEYYVGIWEIDYKGEFMLNILLHSNLPKNNIWATIAKKSQKEFINLINKETKNKKQRSLTSNEKKSLNCLLDAFGELLNSNNTLATSAIGYDLIYKMPQTHPDFLSPILVYPGIESGKLHCNLVIHPGFVNNFMKLKSVYKLSHKVINSNDLTGGILLKGFVDNGKITWKKPELEVSDDFEVIGIVGTDGIKHKKIDNKPFNFYVNNKRIPITNNFKKIVSKKAMSEALHSMMKEGNEAFHLTKEDEEKTDKVIVVEHDDGLYLNNEIPVRCVVYLVKYNIKYE